ncbi:MAG TPA: hypothetical protein VFK05_33785 [Polyangiaceae bacterium]|nr:hypothetical protein [Polyangiaceae bacterium]
MTGRAPQWFRAAAPAFLALSLLVLSKRAHAGGPLSANGSPIHTSEYAIDMFHGPIFAGSRVTGLAGSYVAIAEDVDGDLQNPAAPAVRPFFSTTHFDYWLGFGLTFPATLSNMDFFNSGSKTNLVNPPDSFVFLTPALNLQWGELGVGLNVELQQYALTHSDAGTGRRSAVRVTIPTTHLQFAHGIEHNQLVLGVGARLVSMSLHDGDGPASFSSTGSGLEFGVVYKPENRPIRLGLAFRTQVETQANYTSGLLPNENGDIVITDPSNPNNAVYLPKNVASPWDLNFGFAVQFGKRPMNPPWRADTELNEEQSLKHRLRELARERERDDALRAARTQEERERIQRRAASEQAADDAQLARSLKDAQLRIGQSLINMNRRYLQISASMLMSGAVENAVGVESMVAQVVNRSGQHVVLSPRLGVEAGVIPSLLRVRAGTYIEPTRFDGSQERGHLTAGLDIKLAVWNVFGLWPDDYMWRLGLGADVAHRYATWGITIAGWYPRKTDLPRD